MTRVEKLEKELKLITELIAKYKELDNVSNELKITIKNSMNTPIYNSIPATGGMIYGNTSIQCSHTATDHLPNKVTAR